MNILSHEMLKLIQSSLQVGDQSPTYILRLRRPNEFNLPPKELSVPDGGVVSVEVTGSDQFGCSSATVNIENCYGKKSPEFAVSKHSDDSNIIADSQANPKQQEYYNYLQPETWIQICLGYGWMNVPVLTGAIDTCEINSKEATISLTIRDNMRYLVDQHIDIMLHGPTLKYPRTDTLVVTNDDPQTLNKVSLIKVIDVQNYYQLRIGPKDAYACDGKAYPGQYFQYIGETVNEYGNLWYEISFNGEVRWIFHENAELINSSAIMQYKPIVKVDKTKNPDAHLHVRNGAGIIYDDLGTVNFDQIVDYIETKVVNGLPWFHIQFKTFDGWVCGLYGGVDESSSLAISAKDVHYHIHVRLTPENSGTDLGPIYDGNAYEYVSTVPGTSGLYGDVWHQIKFINENGDVTWGYVSDELASFQQRSQIISSKTVAEVTGEVGTHLHIRSGPSINYRILGNLNYSDQVEYLGSVYGEIDGTVWHHILYLGADGKQHEGYIYSIYTNIHSGYKVDYSNNADHQLVDPTVMIDLTATTNPDTNKWTASGVVHDLSVQALHIGGRGGPADLDRKICEVYTSEFTINDKDTNQPSRYVVNEQEFSYTQTYFDAAMQMVNTMGDMTFRANRYGDIMLFRNKKSTQDDIPDWEIRDYVDLTDASLKYNVQDMRNRVLVIAKNGMSLFEHKGIAFNQCKGVNRQFAMNVPFADTLEQRFEAARSAFEDISDSWRRMSVAVIGNPLIEVGHIVRVYDMVTTATSLFRVSEYKHNFTSESFITQLELVWVSNVSTDEITLLTDNIPTYVKTFRYNLQFSGNIKPMTLKLASTVYRATVKLKNPTSGEMLANIDVKGVMDSTPVDNNATAATSQKYVRLLQDGVNIRTEADLDSQYIKKVRGYGFVMKYLSETDTFYRGIDPEDSGIIYIWKSFCDTYENNGNPSTNLNQQGPVETFISTIESKVGCGYVWGAQGEMLTAPVLSNFEGAYGYSHYHFQDSDGSWVDANKWIGSQVFDCSGLIVWTLQQMGLISSSSDYSAEGLFNDLCYQINKSDVQPGDLFFRQSSSGIYHVGVVVNGGDVVEARGTAYGVIRRALPDAELYGRLKSLAGATAYQTPTNPNNSTPVVVNTTPVPISYTITTTYDVNSAPQGIKDLVTQLNGNLLFYQDDCVLYNVGVESDGAEKNSIVLQWAPTVNAPTNLDLEYDILVY